MNTRTSSNPYYEFVTIAQRRCALFRWPRFEMNSGPHDSINALFAELIIDGFIHELIPEAPYWFRCGLTVALNHSQKYASKNPFRCPLTAASITLQDDIYKQEIGKLSELPRSAFKHKKQRNFTALVVRYGLETQKWKSLREARSWKPDATRFVKWLRSRDWSDYQRAHKHFKPLPEITGS